MTIVAASLVLVMTCWVWLKNSLPDSLSSFAYVVPKWLFSIWVMLVGISLMPPLMSTIHFQWIGFIMVLGLTCVAASPYYREEYKILHYSGAVLCFLAALVSVALTDPNWLLIWVVYPLLVLWKPKYWVLIAEYICFLNVILILYLNH